ncbi:MAG: phospholipase domain-containing protein, partial [Burkholderiales bacterium]
SFSGQLQQPQPELLVTSSNNQLQLTLSNPGTHGVSVTVDRCPYTQQGPWTLAVPGGAEVRQVFACESSGGWYDLTLRSDAGWLRRVAGRLETGAHSISDPLMGRP